MFDETDKVFVERLTPHLARGARTAMLFGEAIDPESPDAPGLLMLSEAFKVQSATPEAARWLEELPDGDSARRRLPASVLAVAGAALDVRPGAASAFARVLSRTGTWMLLHGALLEGGEGRRAAVIIEPAHPARIYPLLMSAYQLTERERDVTSQILRGSSTTQIATDLHISHLVQRTSRACSTKPACAASATWSARSSSTTTSRGSGTASTGCGGTSRYAAAGVGLGARVETLPARSEIPGDPSGQVTPAYATCISGGVCGGSDVDLATAGGCGWPSRPGVTSRYLRRITRPSSTSE
jgi:hypothetical protein